ncbi:MAG: NAD(P)-dependent oxidoreductase [Tannerella sp.]|jgi:nucleoside-diphosphate-sugar epimerase|nr:NAD(P)-dependent oxidoreductase [Tannerella sp.]
MFNDKCLLLSLSSIITREQVLKTKVLITGASGFIGRYLVAEALRRGYEVWAGIRATSSLKGLPDAIHCIDLKYNDADVLTAQLAEHVRKNGAWDYVIHNAGLTKTTRPSDFILVNATYTHHLLMALTRANCKPQKFVLMSSLSSYGLGDEKTFRPISPDDPQHPNTAYGKSKLLAENYVREQSEFPYVILRPTGVYGPGDKDYLMEIKSIRSGFDFAVGMTPQRITFIYVKDLACVVFDALENGKILNRHYFVADGDIYTDTEFARIIQELLQKKHVFRARIPFWLVYIVCVLSEGIGCLIRQPMTLNTDKYKILKQRNWVCDMQPLTEDLNFKPQYNLRKGLEETIAEL